MVNHHILCLLILLSSLDYSSSSSLSGSCRTLFAQALFVSPESTIQLPIQGLHMLGSFCSSASCESEALL
ncbi:hypothetical protein ACLB2K_001878 [Fragaria x ananassa]